MLSAKDRFGTRVMLACDLRDVPVKGRSAALKAMLEPRIAISERAINEWVLDGLQASNETILHLAHTLDVSVAWLGTGKGSMIREESRTADNYDWQVEQRKMFDFDNAERKHDAMAWVLMHQPTEVVEAFCSKDAGHDVRNMRIDIFVNDVELPVKSFTDIVTKLSQAMMDYRFREMGLHSIEATGRLQAESMLHEAHNGAFEKLHDLGNQLEMMRDHLSGITSMFWNHTTYNKLHGKGLFSVVLPESNPDFHGDVETTSRWKAIKAFCTVMRRARFGSEDLDELNKLDEITRSVFAELDEHETQFANDCLKGIAV